MKFNADRLSQLAGIRPGRGSLNEASNRSYHDKVANDDADYRFGKNQLAELDNGREQGREPLMQYEEEEVVPMDERDDWGGGEDEYKRSGGHRTGDVGGHYKDYEMDEADWDDVSELDDVQYRGEGEEEEDVVLELDERMLRGEVRRMRRERASRLEETNLRKAIRNEIKGIFSELDLYKNDNRWVYGDKQPRNSSRGRVSLGFSGPGFK
jgi:hypothetical protein